MLHLLPIRYLIIAIMVACGLVVLLATNFGILGANGIFSDVKLVVNVSTTGSLALIILCAVLWRWLKPIQSITFPYLGGIWEGNLNFPKNGNNASKNVIMIINHNLLKITMILDSDESTSRTLSVQAIRDKGLERDKIYYVFLNERKEGLAGAGDRYRGICIMRCIAEGQDKLSGDYFTEQKTGGTLVLFRKEKHAWWKLWK